MDFKKALGLTLIERGIRAEHIAVTANVSKQAVDSWKAGLKKPSYDALMAIRAAYPELAARIDRSEVA